MWGESPSREDWKRSRRRSLEWKRLRREHRQRRMERLSRRAASRGTKQAALSYAHRLSMCWYRGKEEATRVWRISAVKRLRDLLLTVVSSSHLLFLTFRRGRKLVLVKRAQLDGLFHGQLLIDFDVLITTISRRRFLTEDTLRTGSLVAVDATLRSD